MMLFFKDDSNKIFAYSAEQIKQGYGKKLIPITETEFKSFKLFGVFDKTKKEIQTEVKKLEAQAQIEAKYQAIEDFIYSKYSQKKQAQDQGWINNFRTKLIAEGISDIDAQVVTLATSFLKGATLDDVLKDIDESVKYMYEKLVKVAVKNEWCYEVIQEGKKAIAEDREPSYKEFPVFEA